MRIEVDHITKYFGKQKVLSQINFTLSEPKIYGLLGRNGAGKTTMMDLLCGQTKSTHGTIKFDGKNVFDNSDVLKDICLIKESGNFNPDMKLKDILKTYELLYPDWNQSLCDELMKTYRLNPRKKVKTLSKGMTSAFGITIALSTRAKVTVLDEPYSGLDAAARKKFYNILLDEYELYPRTFIFSTHLIDEVSLLFEEILIIKDGELILHETAETLRGETCEVSGEEAKVEAFIKDKRVMKTEKLAGMMSAQIYGNTVEAKAAGLNVEGITIQDLMINLTEEEEV